MEKVELVLAEDSAHGRAGQRVMLELTPAQVSLPQEIPTYLAGYKNWQFRADEASRIVLVDRREDKYRSFTAANTFQPVHVKGSLTGTVPEIDPETTIEDYKVVDRYVGSFVSRAIEGHVNNAGYDLRMAAARRCARALELDRELDVFGPSGLLTTAGNWNVNNVQTLGANRNWNGGSASDPMEDLHKALEGSAQPVTEIWMNQKVANAFIRHDKVRDHMRQILGDGPAQQVGVSLANLGTNTNSVDFVIPGLPPIRVVASKYMNSSNALVPVMPNTVVLTTVPAPEVPADGEEIATSYTFRWRGPNGVGYESREYIVDNRGPTGGTMIVVYTSDVSKFTSNVAGGLITGVIV